MYPWLAWLAWLCDSIIFWIFFWPCDWRDHVIPTRSGFIFGSVISVIAVIKKNGNFFCTVIGVIMWFQIFQDFFALWLVWLAWLCDSRTFRIFFGTVIGVIKWFKNFQEIFGPRDRRDYVISTRSGFISGSVISVIAVISDFFSLAVIDVIGVIMWFQNLHDFLLAPWLTWLCVSRCCEFFCTVIDVIGVIPEF